MSTIYDPADPHYLAEADVRAELARTFDVCGACRRCTSLCSSFPTLFELLDRHDELDAGLMTPAEQDRVVDDCHHCKLCAIGCPYVVTVDGAIDVPRLMLRATAMHHRQDITPVRDQARSRFLGRIDTIGRLASSTAAVTNRVVGAPAGSLVRKVVAKATGASPVRLLPSFSRERFSTWFHRRPTVTLNNRRSKVTVYPTCLVEYQEPAIGHDLVKVYERNGIECAVSAAGCCGAPSLHAGDIDRFREIAERNVVRLAGEIRAGTDVVVPQPTCSYVVRNDYRVHVGGTDADLVAERTFDAAEYLMRVHRAGDAMLDVSFPGELVDSITYHAPCHLRAQQLGFESRDLLKLTGARVEVIQQCSGSDGMWGLRAGNESISMIAAQALGAEIDRSGGDAVAGDCHLANTAIAEQTGRESRHPLQILARAYGIPEET